MMVSFFYIFMFIWTPLKTITQRTFAPEDSRPRGIFGQEISHRGDFCPKKTLLPRIILSKKMSALWSHCSETFFARKGHPIGKSMWLEQTADTQKSDTLVICSRELLTCKLRAASGTWLLKTCLCFQ